MSPPGNLHAEGMSGSIAWAPGASSSFCHTNDECTPTGSKPRGPHGSRYLPVLEREYQANDPSAESFQTHALCYKRHSRDFLVTDRARTFLHSGYWCQDT